jgi:KDO2-lipid IV(A) lauroyltransferase
MLGWGAAGLGRTGLPRALAERRFIVARNLERVSNGQLRGRALRRAVHEAFESYARYYVESFRLPGRTVRQIADGHDVEGYEHVEKARSAGNGVILALPHLGGWEWSAFWLTQVQHVPVTAVVEPLHPPELFEWFVSFRRSLGMTIVPLGSDAARQVLAALKRNDVVCLLADRDLQRSGVGVDFFGEATTLPAGPATIALRAGVPLLPTAVYFRPGREGVRGVVQPPIEPVRTGRLRDDVGRLTQQLAHAFEDLIRPAPEQWHLMQPNWASDVEALALFRAARRGRRRASDDAVQIQATVDRGGRGSWPSPPEPT